MMNDVGRQGEGGGGLIRSEVEFVVSESLLARRWPEFPRAELFFCVYAQPFLRSALERAPSALANKAPHTTEQWRRTPPGPLAPLGFFPCSPRLYLDCILCITMKKLFHSFIGWFLPYSLTQPTHSLCTLLITYCTCIQLIWQMSVLFYACSIVCGSFRKSMNKYSQLVPMGRR